MNKHTEDAMTIVAAALAAPKGSGLKTIANMTLGQTLLSMDLSQLEPRILPQVQVRTHRKKRINKKWLKKYGTKVVYKHMPTWLTHTYSPADVTFSSEYLGVWTNNTEDALLHGVKENYSIPELVEGVKVDMSVRKKKVGQSLAEGIFNVE